jgi:adenylate kinase family enzyme
VERISVVGSSGSGKTTVARTLGGALGCPHLELDGVVHQADWTPLPDDEFRHRVEDFMRRDRWVIDGNYVSKGVGDLVWDRADTVVWLDLPRSVVARRVAMRSLRRVARREELWNGNTEQWRHLMRWDPEVNVVRWSWTQHGPMRATYEQRATDPRWSHLAVHRLRSTRQVEAFLGRIGG